MHIYIPWKDAEPSLFPLPYFLRLFDSLFSFSMKKRKNIHKNNSLPLGTYIPKLVYLGLEPTEGLNEAAISGKVEFSPQMTGCSYGATGLPYRLSATAIPDCMKSLNGLASPFFKSILLTSCIILDRCILLWYYPKQCCFSTLNNPNLFRDLFLSGELSLFQQRAL